jgi:hypothetical protein
MTEGRGVRSHKVVRGGALKPARATSGKETAPAARTLAAIVGPQTYAVWVEMLKALVPHGRTHRLSVVVAGMLQHAAGVAYRSTRGKAPRGSVAASFLAASETADPEEIAAELGDVLARLFGDAKVADERVNARGDPYSIIDGALEEFVAWENMPWE